MVKDMQGRQFWLNCYVARAVIRRNSPYIDVYPVTRIEDNKIYLDGSKQPIQFPERLLILGD